MAEVELLAGIREAAAERTRSAAELYQELVKAAAAGETGDPDEALEVIQAAGKDLPTFEGDVGRLSSRIRDAELLATQPAAEGRLRKANAELAAVRSEFETVRAEFAKREVAALAKVEGATAELREVEGARHRLVAGADPKLEQDFRFAATMIEAEEKELERLEDNLRRVEKVAAQSPVLVPVCPGDAQLVAPRQAHNHDIETARRRAEQLREQIGAVVERISELRRRQRIAEEAKLVP